MTDRWLDYKYILEGAGPLFNRNEINLNRPRVEGKR